MAFLDSLRTVFQPKNAQSLSAGLYHYLREDIDEKSRIHLRVDPDGTGTLIVNANRIMHLNPTATLMAYLVLEDVEEKNAAA